MSTQVPVRSYAQPWYPHRRLPFSTNPNESAVPRWMQRSRNTLTPPDVAKATRSSPSRRNCRGCSPTSSTVAIACQWFLRPGLKRASPFVSPGAVTIPLGVESGECRSRLIEIACLDRDSTSRRGKPQPEGATKPGGDRQRPGRRHRRARSWLSPAPDHFGRVALRNGGTGCRELHRVPDLDSCSTVDDIGLHHQ